MQCELLDTKTEFVLEKHAQPKFRMPQFEKKSANALIGMCTIEEIPEYKLMIDRQKEANENLQRASNFSASLHQFKDNVRKKNLKQKFEIKFNFFFGFTGIHRRILSRSIIQWQLL